MTLNQIDADFKQAANRYEFLTMEGSGGIICPLRWDSEQHFGIDDLVKHLGLSVLIVANSSLGTINSTVLTAEYIKARDIPVKGIVLNKFHRGDVMEEDNLRIIEEMTKIPVVATVQDDDKEISIDADVLAKLYDSVELE